MRPGSTIGAYLKDLGFNMDAAPDADVLTNPANEVVKYRSFGSDPDLVSRMAAAELKGLNDQGIIGMYKAFPPDTEAPRQIPMRAMFMWRKTWRS